MFLHCVVGSTVETWGPRILIMGASGAGKSSVLNACFGAHVANISHCLPCTQSISYFPATEQCPIHLYDTKGFETQSTNEDGEGFASSQVWCSTTQYVTGWKGLRLITTIPNDLRDIATSQDLTPKVAEEGKPLISRKSRLVKYVNLASLICFLGIHLAGHSWRSSWLATAARGSKPTCVIHGRAAGWKAPRGLVGDGLSPGSRCLASKCEERLRTEKRSFFI